MTQTTLTTLTRWTFTTNHKRIAALYAMMSLAGAALGYALSVGLRLEMGVAGSAWCDGDGQTYNAMVTLHGLVMVFAFVMPWGMGYLGNLLLPLRIGSPEMALPRLNNLSWWCVAAGITVFALGVGHEESMGTGWTVYAPLCLRSSHGGSAVDCGVFALHLLGMASILGSINFQATALGMRAYGVGGVELDLLVWAILITAWLLIVAVPVLAGAITMILLDRSLGTSFYAAAGGGDPMLYEHLFWFFGHPEVYIIILPFFGVLSCAVALCSSAPVYGRAGMVYAMIGIGLVGCYVWAHHMYLAGMDVETRAYFAAATMVIGVPTAIKINNWLLTLYRGAGVLLLDGLLAVGFISMFTLGGLTGLVLANAAVDIGLHDTQYVVGHFHYVLSLGAVFGVLLSQSLWRQKWTGSYGSEALGRCMFALLYVGTTLTFWPMHAAGLAGAPRRIADLADWHLAYQETTSLGVGISIGAVLLWCVWTTSTERNGRWQRIRGYELVYGAG